MEALSKVIYITVTEPDPEWEDEFNRWYDEEHIPNLRGVPGYRSARRYVAVEGEPKYMAFYEIDSIDAFRSPEHDRAANTAWTAKLRGHYSSRPMSFYEQVFPAQGTIHGAAWGQAMGALLTVRLGVAPEHEADFNAWYDQEHLAALAKVPGVIAVRRFRVIEGEPKYMAMYELTEPGVQASEAWQRAIDTPWSARVRETFTSRWRTIYRPWEPAQTGQVERGASIPS
jgi:antibiotic biosynthesis monooxygenase (ABM) superfamily enzyme